MELLRLHRFKKISVIFLFIIVILLFLNLELLYASDIKENESDITDVKNTQDNEESSKKPESLDDGSSSEAIGLLHSSDFDSFIQEKELNNKDNPEKPSEKHSTIKLMEEAPPALDLEEIPRLDNDINTNEKKEEQKSESGHKDSDLHLKIISTPINQEQVSTSTSSSGSSSNSSSDSSAAVSSSASTLESAPNSFSSSVQTSTFNHPSASNQADEEIKLDHEESELKTLSQDSQESYSSTSQRGLRGYKEETHPEFSSGPDSDSGSKPPAGSASASNLASTSNSGSGLLLPGTSEASSDEVELQLLLKSSTDNLPAVDSASEEEKNTTDTEAKTNTNSESSYSSQTDDETELKPQNSSQSEEEDGESKKLKSEMQAEESEFSSDFENNVEFPDDNSKASSSSAKSGSTTSSTGSNTKDEEIAITFEKPEIQEVSTQVENLTKPQETNTSYKYVSVATQTDPIKTSRRTGSSKRRARKVMTKKGLSLLIKEFNTSKTKKKITFFKKLFSRISNDDVNLISTLISREIANREKNHVLRRALSSNIPEKPLLGREWIQREKSKKQTS